MTESGGEPGLIKVTDRQTKEVVVEMPTRRTTKVNIR